MQNDKINNKLNNDKPSNLNNGINKPNNKIQPNNLDNKPNNKIQLNNLNNNQNFRNARRNMMQQGAKMAANKVAGPLGGKAADVITKSKIGQKVMDDIGDKLTDMPKNINPINNMNPLKKVAPQGKSNIFGKMFGKKEKKEEQEEVSGEGEASVKLEKGVMKFAAIGTAGIGGCFTFIFLLLIVCIILSPLIYINNLINNVTSSVGNFFESLGNFLTFNGWCTNEECEERRQNDFYDEIQNVYEDYQSDKSVKLNVTLLTATLTYTDPFLTTTGGDESVTDLDDLNPSNYIDFKKSKEKIELLAEKMVKKICKDGDTGAEVDCSDSSVSNKVEEWKLDIEGYRQYLEDEFIRKFYYDNEQGSDIDIKVERAVQNIFDRVAAYEGFTETTNYRRVYAYCSGVTVLDTDGSLIGTYDLEEYVAGVVSAEAWGGQNSEAYKAQAIAARTYALKRTNNCSIAVESSQSAQVFDPDIEDYARQAALDTAGLVLIYEDEIFSSEYDSFCHNNNCTYGEENGKYYAIYSKLPTMETHKIYLNSEYFHMISGGHGRGMSQLVSYQMANSGSTYDEILKFFYSDGVEIASMNTIIGGYSSASVPPADINEVKERSQYYASLGTITIGGLQFDMSRLYDGDAGNLGQCVWYARSRALELIYSSNMDEVAKSTALNAINTVAANGEGWYSHPSLDVFEKSTDNNMPMPGAIVSWSGGSDVCSPRCGHVAVVESVDFDNKTITISEGYNSGGAGGAASWSNVRVQISTYTFDSIKDYTNGSRYTFNGYVYILGKGE